MQILGTVQSHAIQGPDKRVVSIGTDDPNGTRVVVTTTLTDADMLPLGAQVTITITPDETA